MLLSPDPCAPLHASVSIDMFCCFQTLLKSSAGHAALLLLLVESLPSDLRPRWEAPSPAQRAETALLAESDCRAPASAPGPSASCESCDCLPPVCWFTPRSTSASMMLRPFTVAATVLSLASEPPPEVHPLVASAISARSVTDLSNFCDFAHFKSAPLMSANAKSGAGRCLLDDSEMRLL